EGAQVREQVGGRFGEVARWAEVQHHLGANTARRWAEREIGLAGTNAARADTQRPVGGVVAGELAGSAHPAAGSRERGRARPGAPPSPHPPRAARGGGAAGLRVAPPRPPPSPPRPRGTPRR